MQFASPLISNRSSHAVFEEGYPATVEARRLLENPMVPHESILHTPVIMLCLLLKVPASDYLLKVLTHTHLFPLTSK